MALASILAALAIPADAIDARPGARARTAGGRRRAALGLEDAARLPAAPGLRRSASPLFHLANAAMLPLVGQKLAQQDRNRGTALMSACIVAAQLVMVPMAALAGAQADAWGRKPLFLAGFAVLALRGVLYTLSDDPWWLVAVQSLDGIGAGLFGALMPMSSPT